jgi:hypothetical protein
VWSNYAPIKPIVRVRLEKTNFNATYSKENQCKGYNSKHMKKYNLEHKKNPSPTITKHKEK